jgi:hypothetical protein
MISLIGPGPGLYRLPGQQKSLPEQVLKAAGLMARDFH